LDIFLRNNSVDHETKLKSIKKLKELAINENNLHSFSLFLDSFLTESKYEWLIQGNLTRKEAFDIVNSTENILQKKILSKENIVPIKIANIPSMQNFYYNFLSKDQENLNSSIISYFQVGNLSDKDYCKLLIIEALFREKFFDELRTKQALGYIVRLGLQESRDINGVFCLVQSSLRSPEYLHNVINEFLSNPEFEEIEENEEIFMEYVNSVIDEISKKDLDLREEVLRNFQEIKSKNFNFNKKKTYVNLLKGITLEEVKEFYFKIFNENVKRLDVGLLAHCHKEENNLLEIENNIKMGLKGIKRIKVESANEFKRIITHYPDFYNETVKDYIKI
jgi:secreted Zn-dependent insulinase-like peptidase